MNKNDAKQRIKKLKNVIAEHRYNYHVLDKQTISDSALDSLKHELYLLEIKFPELITADSPTQRVGGEPLSKFEKVTHSRPMLSMEDVFIIDELSAWKQRAEKFSQTSVDSFYCMPKLDGLAVSLVYKDGLLDTGATRGNGIVGENVTQNIKTIESIPLSLKEPKVSWGVQKLPQRVEVRGEIFLPIKEFEKLNRRQKKEGKIEFANPRNAAAGSIRQLDSKVTLSRGLVFVAWNIEADFGQRTMEQEWELLRLIGFRPVDESKLLTTLEDVKRYWKLLQSRRGRLGYWVDGMVVRVNDNDLYKRLGVVGKTPRGLVAWKFPAQESTARVKQINWYVGRTGALTPVALLEPTLIGGTTVQHASLHNFDEIERLDVREGDTVILYKAGDIIPKIKEVIKKLRPVGAKKTSAPTRCPVCDSSVQRKESEVAIYCSNAKCFVQDREIILHSARAFGIDGLGPSAISGFLENNIISKPADLFQLKPEDLEVLSGFGKVSAKKLVEEIQSKKSIKLSRFILALGIRNVGEQTSLDLAEHFHTIESLRKAGIDELESIDGIGDVVAQSVADFFSRSHNIELVDAYIDSGVLVEPFHQPNTVSKFHGKTFVITGTLDSLSRDEAKERIRRAGGNVSGSVSVKTDYVVVGKNPGTKFVQAKKLGLQLLSEKGFLDTIK